MTLSKIAILSHILRAALKYVKRYHSSDEKVKVALLRTILSIDPSCKEVTELAEILMNGSQWCVCVCVCVCACVCMCVCVRTCVCVCVCVYMCVW